MLKWLSPSCIASLFTDFSTAMTIHLLATSPELWHMYHMVATKLLQDKESICWSTCALQNMSTKHETIEAVAIHFSPPRIDRQNFPYYRASCSRNHQSTTAPQNNNSFPHHPVWGCSISAIWLFSSSGSGKASWWLSCNLVTHDFALLIGLDHSTNVVH